MFGWDGSAWLRRPGQKGGLGVGRPCLCLQQGHPPSPPHTAREARAFPQGGINPALMNKKSPLLLYVFGSLNFPQICREENIINKP